MPPSQPSRAAVSVIVPVYNEQRTVESLLRHVLRQDHVAQVIVVDDASADRSLEIVQSLSAADRRLLVLRHARNAGKGAALRTALPRVTGEIVLIQDADLEYDPDDYPNLLAPLHEGRADAVVGARLSGPAGRRAPYRLQSLANRCATAAARGFLSTPLSDVHCGAKAFRHVLLHSFHIEENRFGVDLELLLKIARTPARVGEVSVRYHARSYAEGKKIGWRDAFRSAVVIVKYGLLPRLKAGRRPAASRSA